jgi:SNF2 family DNA or RNA helicase
MNIEDLIEIGNSKITPFQNDIILECLKKQKGGLSLTMGSGKTLVSLILGLEQIKTSNSPILVVCSKTLVESWIFEIKKFFKDDLKYVVLHPTYIKKFNDFKIENDIKVVITTPEIISKVYKNDNISSKFIKQEIVNEGRFGQHFINIYNRPETPYSVINFGGSIIFSINWGCLIVDEIQNYTKISSLRSQGISAICSKHRWGLSGTIFNEPCLERILGYYCIINDETFPRSLPAAEKYIKSDYFKGFNTSLVVRKTNPSFLKPKVNQYIISHELSKEEEKLYTSMKIIMNIIRKKIIEFKKVEDTINTRKFSTYLLAIICYLRQSVVCSILPIAACAIDLCDFQTKSELSNILMEEINKLELNSFLKNKDSVKSTRMKKALAVIDKHKYENIVIFTCFRTVLDIFKTFLPTDRKVYTITSSMSSKKRASVLEEFAKIIDSKYKNILLLTYDIGSEGLNLQVSNTVLLLDFYWNDGKTSQSIARVLRYGQQSEEVNIYFFTSNTAIEKAIFDKQNLKLQIINELESGKQSTSIKKMNVKDIINIIDTEDTINALQKLTINK